RGVIALMHAKQIWPECGLVGYATSLELQRLRPSHIEDKDLSISDTACAGGADNTIADFLGALIADPDADFNLGQKGHAVFAAPAAGEVALVPGGAFGFSHYAGYNGGLRDGPQDSLRSKRLNHNNKMLHVLALTEEDLSIAAPADFPHSDCQ